MTTPRLVFDDASHRYFAGGRRLVSVTQVIERAGLGVDYSMIAPDVLAYAAARGRAVHAACEYIDRGDLDPSSVAPEIAPYVDAYRMFCADTGFGPVDTERRLCSVADGYAGTPDVWGWIGNRRVEIDRKCVAVLTIPAVSLQMAGYHPLIAAYDPTWRGADRYALQLRKTGTYRLRPANTPGADETFRAALAVARDVATAADLRRVREWREIHGTGIDSDSIAA